MPDRSRLTVVSLRRLLLELIVLAVAADVAGLLAGSEAILLFAIAFVLTIPAVVVSWLIASARLTESRSALYAVGTLVVIIVGFALNI
ncbi:MAG: hypothetical protein IH877_08495 [Gemmatimonadetes bacterium]|nr:hypothetical protein [Gemmatimonadota bacterium]MCZ6761332.1 hypothetical protein [Gemmatimonadota bacterium]